VLLSACQPANHRRPRNPASTSDFTEIHPVHEAQGETDALIDGHAIQHPIERAHCFLSFGVGRISRQSLLLELFGRQ
jgi:hypothetical protein